MEQRSGLEGSKGSSVSFRTLSRTSHRPDLSANPSIGVKYCQLLLCRFGVNPYYAFCAQLLCCGGELMEVDAAAGAYIYLDYIWQLGERKCGNVRQNSPIKTKIDRGGDTYVNFGILPFQPVSG